MDPEQAKEARSAAHEAMRLGDFERALEIVTPVVRAYPEDGEALFLSGLAWFELGETTPALSLFDRLVELYPETAEAHARRGFVLEAMGRTIEAARAFSRALEIEPDHERALEGLQALIGTQPKRSSPARQSVDLSEISTSLEKERASTPQERSSGSPRSRRPVNPRRELRRVSRPSAARSPSPDSSPARRINPEGETAHAPKDLARNTRQGDGTSELLAPRAEARRDVPGWMEPGPTGPYPAIASIGTLDKHTLEALGVGGYDDPTPPRPGLWRLCGAALLLCLQRPLAWLIPLSIAIAAGMFLSGGPTAPSWQRVSAYFLAFIVGATPALVLLWDQWRGDAGEKIGLGPRLLAVASTLLFLHTPTLVPVMFLLDWKAGLPGQLLLPVALLLTLPFHALAAPAMADSAEEAEGGVPALRFALTLTTRRSWLHLLVLVVTNVGAGSLFAGVVWGLATATVGGGDVAFALWEVLGLSLGIGLWAASVIACGADALIDPTPPEDTYLGQAEVALA